MTAATTETTAAAAPEAATFEPSRADGDLVLLPNGAMHARRRPFALLALYLWETCVALLVAWPTATLVRGAYGSHPRGDAPLWNAGGLELLDLLERTRHAAPAVLALTLIVTGVAAMLGLVPTASLLVSVGFATRARRGPSPLQTLARALRAFPSMLLVFVLVRAMQGILLFIGGAAAGLVTSAFEQSAGEARAAQLGWLAFFLFLLLVWGAGTVLDLARAAIIRFRVRGLRALGIGFSTFRRSLVFWSWAWRAIASLVPLGIGAFVADRLGGSGGFALFALFVIHQGVVATRIALQGSWLARAMRAVDHGHRVVAVIDDDPIPAPAAAQP